MPRKPVKLPWSSEPTIPPEIEAMTKEECTPWCAPNLPPDHEHNIRSTRFHPEHGTEWQKPESSTAVAELDPNTLTEEEASAVPKEQWLDAYAPNLPPDHPINRVSKYFRSGQHLRDAENAAATLKAPAALEGAPPWFSSTEGGAAAVAMHAARVAEFRRDVLKRLADAEKRSEAAALEVAKFRDAADAKIAKAYEASCAARNKVHAALTGENWAELETANRNLSDAQGLRRTALVRSITHDGTHLGECRQLRALLRETAPACIGAAEKQIHAEIEGPTTTSDTPSRIAHVLHLRRAWMEIRALAESVVDEDEAKKETTRIRKTVPRLGTVKMADVDMDTLGFAVDWRES